MLYYYRFCEVVYYPPKTPDLCWDAVRMCPNSSSPELSKLCSSGNANYMNLTTQVYRNQFCAMCHGEDLFYRMLPNKLTSPGPAIQWQGKKLVGKIEEDAEKGYFMIATLQPQLQHHHTSKVFNESFGQTKFTTFHRNSDIVCSFYMNQNLTACFEEISEKNLSHISLPAMDLGSVACFSPYRKVCDFFILPDTSKIQQCAEAGCGPEAFMDPATLTCHQIKDYNLQRSNQVIKALNQTWHSALTCSYQSRCRAAELGLVKLHDLNCHCDKFCTYFNDCCEDSPFQATSMTKLEEGTFSCKYEPSDFAAGASKDFFYWGVQEVDMCPSSYDQQDVKSACETNSWRSEGRASSRHGYHIQTDIEYSPYGIHYTPVTHTKTTLR